MNSKYIKRQLTLNEIGIPMPEDVERYYGLFNEIFSSDIKIKLEKDKISNVYEKCFYNERKLILVYTPKFKEVFTDSKEILEKFELKFNLEISQILKILHAFLEYKYNITINSII